MNSRLDDTKFPATRSRAGDFVFAAAAGLFVIVATTIVGSTSAAFAMLLVGIYLGLIGLRYFTLVDAVPVSAGTNVTEEQLETLARLRAVLNSLPQPVMLIDEASIVAMTNPAAERMFDDDVVGRHISGLIRQPHALGAIRAARLDGQAHEVEMTTMAPVERTTLFYAAPLSHTTDPDNGNLIIMLRDRTEQKKLEKMRSDFVASASHELRTPLTSMGGFIETLQGHAKDDPEAQQKFLGIMANETGRMLSLVEDLMGLSEIELKQANQPNDVVDLVAVARNVIESLGPLARAEAAELSLHVDGDADQCNALGDKLELFRVIQNLCDNALKYAGPENARVDIHVGDGAPPSRAGADRTGDTPLQVATRLGVDVESLVWVSVRDHGVGIVPTDLPRVTERFYRVRPEISRSRGGTGLGLAIVKHIVQRHRGGIIIESVEGEGASFTCMLPPGSEAAFLNDTVPQS